MKVAWYIGGLLGLILLVGLFARADLGAMLHALDVAGWKLLLLVPYRAGYFLLYAIGWRELLLPYDAERRASFAYIYWVTTVRDAIDRLLPVASIGGGVAAVRLMRWRNLPSAPIVVSVIVEILLTLIVVCLFTAMGLLLLLHLSATGGDYRWLLLAFLLSLPVPALAALLLRYGSVFKRLHRLLRPIVGARLLAEGAESLDEELRASLRRWRALLLAGGLQFLAFISASFEIWFALRLFGYPISVEGAVALESVTQAARYLAFIVPAGIGVQEAGFVLFGHMLGIGADFALAVSMAKRLRELLCGVPSLISWQWLEGRRLHGAASHRP
ncbi:MAG: lysylphosphatidylglycerol synthase domain-containing protein [Steroidobacteraceae bacterium]